MIAELARRIDLVLAEGVVRVESELLRTAAGEVLHGQRDRGLGLEWSALQMNDQRLHDVGGEIGILGEGLMYAIPAWFGAEVGHVAVHAAQADRLPFLAHYAGELLDHRHVADRGRSLVAKLLAQRGGGDAGLLGEFGHHARRVVDAGAGIALEVVAGVRLEQRGDAEPGGLGHRLDGVHVFCCFGRGEP